MHFQKPLRVIKEDEAGCVTQCLEFNSQMGRFEAEDFRNYPKPTAKDPELETVLLIDVGKLPRVQDVFVQGKE